MCSISGEASAEWIHFYGERGRGRYGLLLLTYCRRGLSALWDMDGWSRSGRWAHLTKLGPRLLLLHPSVSHQVVEDLAWATHTHTCCYSLHLWSRVHVHTHTYTHTQAPHLRWRTPSPGTEFSPSQSPQTASLEQKEEWLELLINNFAAAAKYWAQLAPNSEQSCQTLSKAGAKYWARPMNTEQC